MADHEDQAAYNAGHSIGVMMKEQRDEGDHSYDCRWDLSAAAKEPGGYFEKFKQGLEDGLNGK